VGIVDAEKLAGAFVDLTRPLSRDGDITDVLQALVEVSAALLRAEAVGVLIADRAGRLSVVASSSEPAHLLELYQIQSDEGPCLDAFRHGHVVSAQDLARDERWPRFSPAAVAAGYRCACAVPMRVHGTTIGGLNLFGAESRAAELAEQLPVAQSLADVASIAFVQARAARDKDELNHQLQTALDTRVAIEQAKGRIAAVLAIGMDEAFALLRNTARSSNRRLSDLAHEVATERVPPERLAP
jgi:GAF domain-containing protein